MRKCELTRLVCVFVFASAAVALSAETEIFPQDELPQISQPAVVQSALRPQRAVRQDYSGPESGISLPARHFAILTPENMSHPLTMHYIERYTRPSGIVWLNSVLRRAALYLPFIKAEIEKRGLPPELAYLPVIESEFIGTARSRSGAMGIWQFMLNSIGTMRVNDMLDERRDFRKATVSALVKLERNYRSTGSWPMALAAYNAGLGAATRAAQRAGTRCYWELSARNEFRRETIHFVPRFVAVAYILSNPRRYNVDYWPATVEWTTIRPERQVSLDAIVAETGVNRTLLFRLNQELLYGITPPVANYELVVPLAYAERIAAVLRRDDIVLLRHHRHQIRYGDTLYAISRHYGITVAAIEDHNPGLRGRFLRIGETITVPVFRDVAPFASVSRPASTASPAIAGNTDFTAFTGTHTVIRGDTLWSIAGRHHVAPLVLARANNIELDSILSIGKILRVPIIE